VRAFKIQRLSSVRVVRDTPSISFWERIFLAALFLVAVTVRLWGISKIHYWDEMVYLQNAQVICCGKTNYSELLFRPPLISIFYAGIFKLWHSIYGACIGAALLNALAPVYLFLAGRLSVGRRAALLASSLLALGPFFVGIFPEGFDSDITGNSLLTDSPALTLITLSFWLLLRATWKPSLLRFFWAGVALASCVLMRFGFLSSVGVLLLLPFFSTATWKGAVACLSGLIAGLTPYFLWSALSFGNPFLTLKEGWLHVEGPTQPFTFFVRNAPAIFSPIAIAGLVLFIAWKIFARFSHALYASTCDVPDKQLSQNLQAYLLAWLAIAFLAFSCIPHKEPRYIMPAAPPLFLLAGLGLSMVFRLRRNDMRWAAVGGLSIWLSLTVLPLRALFHTPFIDRRVPDEELAGKLLSATLPPATTLYMSFNYPTLAYYTNFRIHELPDVGPALYRDMESVPAGEVLVVYREAENPSQSDIAWCDSSHLFARIASYPSLVAYRRLSSPSPQ
jgi:4-amino-4-deoxy-L-arabinose transferase-like glycosyltransferase